MLQTITTHVQTSSQHAAHHGRRMLSTLLACLHEQRLPITAITLYALALLIYIDVFHLEHLSHFSLYGMAGATLFGLSILFFFIIYCIQLQLHDKPNKLIPHVIIRLKEDFFTYERFFNAGIAITLFSLLLASFSNFKRMIPGVIPFHLDTTFVHLDRWLHFGVDPWRLLQPLIGYPLATFSINFLYNIWLFVIIMVFYWQAFASNDKRLRLQFIFSFILCWMLIGSVAATLLSSAGPCYYDRFGTGPNIYAPLMAYLHHANETYPIWALNMQQTLLTSYDTQSTVMASGITAMPSMHVSIAFLMALLGWRVNRFAGWAFSIYCLSIMIGSVHLGWHYAADGYVSILLTAGIWRACGWAINRGS